MLKERPLNEQEIKILNRNLKQLDKRIVSDKKFLLGWIIVALVVGTIAFLKLDSMAEYYLLFGTVFVYIMIGVWVYFENTVKIRKEKSSICFALSENKVKSIRVVSDKYLELAEEDDEGVFYLFQVEDNKILSFGGQDYVPTNKFPSTDFEIVMCYGQAGELILLEKSINGQKLQPAQKITGKRKQELLSSSRYPDPDNFTVIEGKIEEIEDIILEK